MYAGVWFWLKDQQSSVHKRRSKCLCALSMEKGEVLNCTVIDEKTVECFGERFSVDEGLLQASNGLFWVYLCLYMVLVLFAGECV